MSDNDGIPSSPFERHAAFDGDEADSASAQNDEESTSTISDSPPPMYYAYPQDEESPAEPAPAKTAQPWSIPWPVTLAMVAAAVIVVALVAAIVVIVTNREPSSAPPAAAPTTPGSAAPSTVAAPPPVTVTSEETITETKTALAPPSPTYPTYDPESAGLRQLQLIANTDQAAVLNGATNPDKWVPQLGSKKFGTTDNETFYDYPRIVQDFYQIKRSYPSARLLRSGDWSTFGESDYWVTIAGITFPTSDGALSWCSRNGLDNNHCYAKLISTTQGTEGSTAYQ